MSYKVWYGETPHLPSGPGRIVVVCVALDEEQCRKLALDMIGRAGRSTIAENVARMTWDVIGNATTDGPELTAGHWSR